MQDAADLGTSPCALPPPHGALALFDAIRYSLCSDPKTRQEWSALQVQAARLGQAKAAFWPKLDGSVQASRDHSITNVSGQPIFNSDRSSTYQQQMLSMSWTLYDFGARSAQARAAQELLTASHYALDDALQSAVLRVAATGMAWPACLRCSTHRPHWCVRAPSRSMRRAGGCWRA